MGYLLRTRTEIFPDLSNITLPKRRNFKFLTFVLQQEHVFDKWGFLFKPMVNFDMPE